MPRWKGIHAFPLEVETRALDAWVADAETRAAVLAVAEAALEIVSARELRHEHVHAFVRCARVEHPDPRAWGPGVKRLVEVAREFGEQAGAALDAMLRDPTVAARLLSLGVALTDAERELALNTVMAASTGTRRGVIAGEPLRRVRIAVQHREVELDPRGVEATLAELERLVPGGDADGVREGGPLLHELQGRLEPHHRARVLSVIEAWPDEDLGGFLRDLVRCVAACDGGQQEILESFQRRPSLAVADYLRYDCEGVDPKGLFEAALARSDLSPRLRGDLLDAMDHVSSAPDS